MSRQEEVRRADQGFETGSLFVSSARLFQKFHVVCCPILSELAEVRPLAAKRADLQHQVELVRQTTLATTCLLHLDQFLVAFAFSKLTAACKFWACASESLILSWKARSEKILSKMTSPQTLLAKRRDFNM